MLSIDFLTPQRALPRRGGGHLPPFAALLGSPSIRIDVEMASQNTSIPNS